MIKARTLSSLTVFLFALPSHAILGGTADASSSLFRYVGKMSNGFAATPITSTWLVTAAHVAPTVGSTYTNLDGTYKVAKVVKDPNNADVALVQVSGKLIHTYEYGVASVSENVSIVGYGATGAVGTSPKGAAGTRFVANNTIDGVIKTKLSSSGPLFKAYAYDLDNGTAARNSTGSATPVASGEGGLSSGDSGGGWFVTRGDKAVLVAVASGVLSQYAFNGTGSKNVYDYGAVGVGATLVDSMDFIRATTATAQAVPEPSSLAFVGLGGLALVRRRTRRQR